MLVQPAVSLVLVWMLWKVLARWACCPLPGLLSPPPPQLALISPLPILHALQSGVFSILSTVYVGEFNSAKLAAPLAKMVKHA